MSAENIVIVGDEVAVDAREIIRAQPIVGTLRIRSTNPYENLIDRVAEEFFAWTVDMEERRIDTGFKVIVGGISTGPSGMTWGGIGSARRASLQILVAMALAGADAVTPEEHIRAAFVTSVARLLCPDATVRKQAAREYLGSIGTER